MAADQGSGPQAPRNLRFLKAAFITVRPSRTTDTIALEVADSAGDGFIAEFSQALALDAAMKLIGGIARARGWSES